MGETVRLAIAAIGLGDYCEADIRLIKEHLSHLNKQESTIRRQMERDTNEFVKNKGKKQHELKIIRNDIKELKNLLKAI